MGLSMSACLLSNTKLWSELSSQRCLNSKQPWKAETLFSSGAEGRVVSPTSIIKTRAKAGQACQQPSYKIGEFPKLGDPQL